jgi:hypothetical protein
MNFLSRFLLSFLFVILFGILCLTVPAFFIFNKEKTKETLVSMNLYEYITPIVRKRSVQFLTHEDGFFKEVLEKNIDKIIEKDWIQNLTEKIIDEGFEVFYKEKDFENLDIEIIGVKENFLEVLNETDLRDNIEEIAEQIPDSVSLSQIMGIEESDLKNISLAIINLRKVIKWGVLVLSFLILLIVLLVFLSMENNKVLSFLLTNIFITSIFLFSLPFVYKNLILDSQFLSDFMNQISSNLQKILLITSLTFLDRLTKIWSFVGVLLLLIIVGIKMIRFIVKRDPEINSG